MANSDYTIRTGENGFCPYATLAEALDYLEADATMTGFTSPFDGGIRIGMAALIDEEIVVVQARAGNLLTLGRGCCDTVPALHSMGAIIWFFDDSIGTDSIEYAGTETIGVKLLPRTSTGQLPIENSPPQAVSFNLRFERPYAPGQVKVNAVPWFNVIRMADSPTPVGSLTLTWVHRDRVGQADVLIDHLESSVGPEPGTTYTARVYKADNTLVRTQAAIAGTSWVYNRVTATLDFGVAVGSGVHNGYITLHSVRDAIESYQHYRINFELDATFIQAIGMPVETDTALPMMLGQKRTIGLPTETDIALPMLSVEDGILGLAGEQDIALELLLGQAFEIQTVTELDISLAMFEPSFINNVVETDSALPMELGGPVDPLYSETILILNNQGADNSAVVNDLSPIGRVCVMSGALIDTANAWQGVSSAYFNGVNDYIYSNDLVAFDFGTDNFCAEVEFLPAVTIAKTECLLTTRSPSGADFGIQIGIYPNGVFVQVWGPTAGTLLFYYQSDHGAISPAFFHHVALERIGDDFNVLLDGDVLTTITNSGSIANPESQIIVGADPSTISRGFYGWIGGVRVTRSSTARYPTFPYTLPTEFPTS